MAPVQKYKNKSFICLASVTALLLISAICFWDKLFLNECLLYWIIGVIIFLALYELVTILVVNKQSNTARPQQLVTLYMFLKGAKIFLFLGALIIYILVIKVESKRFVLVAVALYFIYLLLDTLFISWIEKRIKIENQNRNDK